MMTKYHNTGIVHIYIYNYIYVPVNRYGNYVNHLSAKVYVRTVKRYEHKLRFRAIWDIFTTIKNVAYRNLQDMLGFAHKNREWIQTYFDDADVCVII